ncbi:hypothetical protein GCM10010911_50250 [Paenibacillus nasutitermitis]|uniref:Uncharacterized protein n=1 Tax=Paenibacillus nasutitermitis TaxID=1652958 RepID=A0A917DZL2_9BACL|nr:hypothetical protein GCM10010911_50250 [Paenibacillus nasutitermitis]
MLALRRGTYPTQGAEVPKITIYRELAIWDDRVNVYINQQKRGAF